MPDKPTAPKRTPIAERELAELLLWLFNTTGYYQHVEAFRRHAAAEKAASTRTEKKD